MGSTGSGRFSDYPGTRSKKVGQDGADREGGASGQDKCKKAFTVLLEDVGNCDLYSQSKVVPSVGEQLSIHLDKKRVLAVNVNGVSVGALPTEYNYLVACMNDGFTYVGVVTSSAVEPVPTISADFKPQ
ncbi:hypothetical protein [Kangiella sp. M94]